MSANEILEKIYYDLERGYGSVRSLYEEANKDGAGVTLQYVKDWVKKQKTQRRNYKNYNSYSAPYARAVFSVDIMDMISLMKDTNTFKKEYKRYALLCIDNFSKKLHIVPMENRDGVTVYDAFMECFKVMGFPNSIYSDDDGAFNYKKLQDYLKGEGIDHIITLTHANVAERAIRTVKKMITDRALVTKGAWTILLQPVLNKYNKQMKHSTTDMVPDEAHKDENVVKVKANSVLKEKYLRKYPKVEVGDKVKVFVKGKGNYTSRKESRNQWSEQTYTVKEIGRDLQLNKHYILDGKTKKYNRHEILLVD